MTIAEAQHEVRSVFLNGAVGQAVSGVIWLSSAAAASFGSIKVGILILVLGGIAAGFFLGFRTPAEFSTGGWITGVILVGFAAWARATHRAEARSHEQLAKSIAKH